MATTTPCRWRGRAHLPLISKLRCDAALYFPYTGPYAGRGPHRTYGGKLEYPNIPAPYLKETTVEGHIHTRLYQAQRLHKAFAHALNVVIIVKMHLQTHTRGHVHPVQQRPGDLLRHAAGLL